MLRLRSSGRPRAVSELPAMEPGTPITVPTRATASTGSTGSNDGPNSTGTQDQAVAPMGTATATATTAADRATRGHALVVVVARVLGEHDLADCIGHHQRDLAQVHRDGVEAQLRRV